MNVFDAIHKVCYNLFHKEVPMQWKCPGCKKINTADSKKCGCGYAYYSVLGIKEDAPAESVEQTYQYLIKVWRSSGEAHDSRTPSKSDERIRKIDEAFAVFKQIQGNKDIKSGTGSSLKIAIAAGSVIIVALVSAFLFFSSKQDTAQQSQDKAVDAAAPVRNATPGMPAVSPQPSQGQTSAPATPERPADRSESAAAKTSDWAIDTVKKSHALDRLFTVETLTNKWTTENSDKLKAIGWIAKKVDDKAYLVSYTATDGVTPKGFYFEINIETEEIRNIANHPDLLQKYGIKGN